MKKITIILIASFFIMAITNAQTALRAKEFNLEKGLAIQGYDPVAYFTQNKAVKGAKQFATLAEGVTYYFSTAENKDLFVKDYKKYEPQYGGWCAYAMGATNEKVEIDPETFKIVNGKLFLFYHTWVNNTLNKWNKDEANLKAAADKNWTVFFR
ncbi:MAG: YHS domain-containing (seleno)protein [Panacibacter sp.]